MPYSYTLTSSSQTLCTLCGECQSPVTGMPSATAQGESQQGGARKILQNRPFPCFSVSRSRGLTSLGFRFPNESSPPALRSWECWEGAFWASPSVGGGDAAWHQLRSAPEQPVPLISFPANKIRLAHLDCWRLCQMHDVGFFKATTLPVVQENLPYWRCSVH